MKCPATSPESGTPCSLRDDAGEHPAGHESAYLPPDEVVRVCWPTTREDHERWG